MKISYNCSRRHPRLKIALLIVASICIIFRHHVLAGVQLAAMPLLFKLGNVGNPLTLEADNFDVTFERYSTEPDRARGDDQHYAVPPIIHNIFIGNNATLRPAWDTARATCRAQHPGYTFEYWDEERAKDFVQRQFPTVWPTWRDYEFSIQKADSLRYMLLYYYGGTFPSHMRIALRFTSRPAFITVTRLAQAKKNLSLIIHLINRYLHGHGSQLPTTPDTTPGIRLRSRSREPSRRLERLHHGQAPTPLPRPSHPAPLRLRSLLARPTLSHRQLQHRLSFPIVSLDLLAFCRKKSILSLTTPQNNLCNHKPPAQQPPHPPGPTL